MIIGFLLPKAPKIWPYTKWIWKHSQCPLKTMPNQNGLLE
jgi:hypothetical protein